MTTKTLSTFPVDDYVLDTLELAMEGALAFNEDDELILVGAVFGTDEVLDKLGGYHHTDVIRALIAEVRRLRG